MSNGNEIMHPRKRKNVDDFVSSMTFANNRSNGFGGNVCGCSDDDCGGRIGAIPAPIYEALQSYKLSRLTLNYHSSGTPSTGRHQYAIPLVFHGNKPKQQRHLMTRMDGVTVWKYSMPCDAEPLIEYGSSHRLVYVEQLSQESKIISIGRGIYGSRMEEQERVLMNWKSKTWYLLPSNGGVSLGWIHKLEKSTASNKSNLEIFHDINKHTHLNKDAVVLVLKFPVDFNCAETSSLSISNGKEKDKAQTCVIQYFFSILETYLKPYQRAQKHHYSKEEFIDAKEIGRFGGIQIAECDNVKLSQALARWMPNLS